MKYLKLIIYISLSMHFCYTTVITMQANPSANFWFLGIGVNNYIYLVIQLLTAMVLWKYCFWLYKKEIVNPALIDEKYEKKK